MKINPEVLPNMEYYKWHSVKKHGIPIQSDEFGFFLVFCPAIDPENPEKCIKEGTFTTHNRGIGIRPKGPEYYHLCFESTHWRWVEPPCPANTSKE